MDKKLWQRLSDSYTEIDLLFEVLTMSHSDMNKSAQLVPKLKKGCEEWLKENQLPNGFDTQQMDDKQREMLLETTGNSEFRHVSRDAQKKKLH